MEDHRTTVAVQQYLDELAAAGGETPAEPIVSELLGRAANRLHQLCAALLVRSYPRLTRPPFNLQSEEVLGGVVERMLRAVRQVRPKHVRQFFALANQHMRWELNDLARRLDEEARAVELRESLVPAAAESSGSPLSESASRILGAIEALPEEEREVFSLVRLQGMTHAEAAEVIGVAQKTVQRRLNRSLFILSERLGDLVDVTGGREGRADGTV